VAVGVANIVNLLDCDVVVVGGGLVDMGELLMAPVRTAYQGLVLAAEHRPPVAILPARLGSDAGAIGAWLLARDLLAGPAPGSA
jgi:glucokinase